MSDDKQKIGPVVSLQRLVGAQNEKGGDTCEEKERKEEGHVKHIVALSGGKDSTAMALRLSETEPKQYQYCITPTGRELPAMEEHWRRLECLLGQPLTRIPGPSMLDLVIKWRALPTWRMRWCTKEIKIVPFHAYALTKLPAICYVGIRADETDRAGAIGLKEGISQDCPLVRWGWGINHVKQYLADKGVEIPERTDCDMCFFQRIAEWWRLWRDHRDRWQELVALEEWTGHTLRSEQRDSWPASLKELGDKFESGYVPKGAAQTLLRLDVSDRPTMCAWCAR